MTELVTSTFLGIGIVMTAFAALQLSARRKATINWWLGLLFLGFGYVWLYFGLYRATRFAWAPWLLYSDVVVTFLVGPLMYLYARSLAGGSGIRITALRHLSFLPSLGVLGYLVVGRPWSLVSPSSLPGPDPAYSAVPTIDLLNTIGDSYFFCFALMSTIVVVMLHRRGNADFRRAFRGVLVYFLVGLSTFVLFFAGHAMDSDAVLALATLINGINGTWFFFYSYRHPEHSQKTVRQQARRPRAADSPGDIDARRTIVRLEKIVEGPRGYCDPGITLQSLAGQLGIQYFQLSQILNDTLHTSFRGYINERRLAEARKLLAEKPDMSVLEIAFAVGFNSKSAFNAAFVRQAGCSPTQFRKKAR